MHSCLYAGRVRHRRFTPKQHGFTYRVFYAYLDLDELDQAFKKRWLWSTRRPALARFKRSDYLGDKDIPLKQAVMERVEHYSGQIPQGPIRVLTHLRYFGLIFNPVSFYYCFNKDDTHIEYIVAEITNTPWGERYSYVLPVNSNSSKTRHLKYEINKDFHVSPFMPMDIAYKWYFSPPDERLNIHMINLGHGKKIFDATLTLEKHRISAGSCALALAAYPFMTLKVLSAIYWQALRIYLKGVPFYTHPKKLDTTDTGDANSAQSQ